MNESGEQKLPRSVERFFKRLGEKGSPKTIETIQNEWEGIPYTITHRDSKYAPWHLRFTGIELPKYDGHRDGAHNNLVRSLFDNLLAQEMEWGKIESPANYSGVDASNPENTTQIPGTTEIHDVTNGNIIARKTISSYLRYKDKIDAAISEIERIYKIDPTTRRSIDLGFGSSTERTASYPSTNEALIGLKAKFGLDYIAEK